MESCCKKEGHQTYGQNRAKLRGMTPDVWKYAKLGRGHHIYEWMDINKNTHATLYCLMYGALNDMNPCILAVHTS